MIRSYLLVVLFLILLSVDLSLQVSVRSARKKAQKEDQLRATVPPRSSKASTSISQVHHIPLEEIVKNRPKPNSYNRMRNYAKQFSRHPDVQKIKLKGRKTEELAQAFVDLRGSNDDPLWHRKMTASIKQHLRDNDVDEGQIREIQRYYQNGRNRIATKKYKDHYMEKDGDAYREMRAKSAREQTARRRRNRSTAMMDRPLKFHLGTSFGKKPYTDLVDKAVALNRYYTSPKAASWNLRQYMLEQGYSEEETNMAVVARTDKVRALAVQEDKGIGGRAIQHSFAAMAEKASSSGVKRVRLPEGWYKASNL